MTQIINIMSNTYIYLLRTLNKTCKNKTVMYKIELLEYIINAFSGYIY